MDDKNPLKMKVSELKSELGRRGLSQTGLKFDLAQRLQTAMDVDEFGALPSLTIPTQSSSLSSSLIPVLEKGSTDNSNSPPHSPHKTSCESAQGGPPDEQPQELGITAETSTEAAPPIEQPCLEGASIVADATHSEGGALPSTEGFLSEERLGCGEKGRDQTKANSDGSDDKIHTGVTDDDDKIAGDSGGTVELGEGGAGGSNERTNETEEGGATASANEETTLLSFSSSNATEYVRGGESSLPLLSDPTNLTSTPASPQKGTERVEEGHNDRPEVAAEERDGEPTQRNGANPDHGSDPKITGAKADLTNGKTQQAPVPDSLLLSSLTERMKDREKRFHQENKKPDNKTGRESEVRGETGKGNPGPPKASGQDRGGKVDGRSGGGGESGRGISASTGDARQEAHGAQTVEEARKAKLLKRKERFMAPPASSSGDDRSAKSGNSSSANLGTAPGNWSSREVPSGASGEKRSELSRPRRQTASEVAARMARRSERFGVKGAGSSVPRAVSPAEVRDPRGSFFAESEGTLEADIEQSPPTSTPYSFDPLPQRQKRARDTATPSDNSDGAPAKRRGADGGVVGALERTTSPGAVEGQSSKHKAPKTTERRNVRFLLASGDGVDESPARCEETDKSSPRLSSSKRFLGSAFVLLGVKKKKNTPKVSRTATAKGKGKAKGHAPPPHSRPSRGRDEVNGESSRPSECLDRGGKADKQCQQRDGPTETAAPQASVRRRPRREERAEHKFAGQAAKMAERRKRFAEDPLAPSFR